MTAIYIRVSTVDQRLEAQELSLRKFCRTQGWTDLVTYSDKLSGKHQRRPGLKQLLNSVKAGKIERVVCFAVDRLGRTLLELTQLVDTLERSKVPLILSSQDIDTSKLTRTQRMVLGMLMVVAEFELALNTNRILAGIESARERGTALGRPSKQHVFSATVKTLRLQGVSFRKIAKQLNLPLSTVHALA